MQDKFVEAMSEPDMYPKKAAELAGYRNPSVSANQLLKNSAIAKRIEERKREALNFAFVTPEMIIGATALRAFATIDDVLDDSGNFDIAKARKTGAIHLVKRLIRKKNKFGGYDTLIDFYSNESAQDKLANYMGLERAPRNDNEIHSLKQAVEQIAQAIANGNPQPEHYSQAWGKVRAWAAENRARYSPEAIDTVAKEFE